MAEPVALLQSNHTGIVVARYAGDKVKARHNMATHTEHALSYIVDGHLRMEHGEALEAGAGTVVLIPAGAPHRPLENSNLQLWMTGFCATCVRMDETQLLMEPFMLVRRGALPLVSIPKGRRARLVRLFRELEEESKRTTPDAPELARCLLKLLLGEVRRAMKGAEVHASDGSLVADALAFIQRNCLEPISLRDVAQAVHRTPSHVASTVKAKTGHSVGDWIRSGRVGEAATRLVHTDASLDEIAASVGWQDKTHFIRQFRKVYGTTPAAFRKAQGHPH